MAEAADAQWRLPGTGIYRHLECTGNCPCFYRHFVRRLNLPHAFFGANELLGTACVLGLLLSLPRERTGRGLHLYLQSTRCPASDRPPAAAKCLTARALRDG